MTKKPGFWLIFVLLAAAAAILSALYFTRAFPLFSLDLRMDRQSALARAAALAADEHLGPSSYRAAASFSIDESLQTFVELEGGGKQAFATLLADHLFTPYQWKVRHFQEREKNEAIFTFAPDGTANGFLERLREDAPGASLSAEAARVIAERSARERWNADLTTFQSVEQSEERRPGGRVDYAFVYERQDRRIGEGRYRLRLTVSGDKLTELTYFLKIPDAFERRYAQMRSVNTAIGIGGTWAFLLLYGGAGIGFGLFILMRHRWVLWRQPVFWGVVVALAQTAARINEWPLAWMEYDTALSTRSFLAQQVGIAVLELAAYVGLFSLSFMAAESLTRRAFPRHPQFWRVWGRDAGRSSSVLGRTVAGYLLVPVFIAYEVALYFVATRSLGWWSPSEALFNPDVLAAYAPWVSAIARSLQAGFWEESMFRAIPIAGAALIGDRLGGRRYWIVLAFIVQAVIFGAGHAPYPTQPAYARPVELVLPSVGFGLLYLVFGLLPGILLHFAFDAFWFAMPLFATSAAGIRVQQTMIVVMVFVPLWVVILRRITARDAVAEVPRNETWQPEAAVESGAVPQVVAPRAALSPTLVGAILGAGVVAAVIWAVAVVARPIQHHQLLATSADAVRAARTALGPTNLGPEWRFQAVTTDAVDSAHRFVWQTGGRSTYTSLLGTYLDQPGWSVSVKTFQGDVADRAENWTVYVDAKGSVQRVTHELPESRAGGSLTETEARDLAARTLVERFGTSVNALKSVSTAPSKLPQRTDWTVTFADTTRTLPQGELRLLAHIAGSEVADVSRFVFVPEEWRRTERNAQTVATVVQGATLLLSAIVVIGGVVSAIVSWSRHKFRVSIFLLMLAAFLVLGAGRVANSFPMLMAQLSTAQPLRLQIAVLLGSSIVAVLVQAVAMALVAGVAPSWCSVGHQGARRVAIALALGALAAAIPAVGAWSTSSPHWAAFGGAATIVPALATVIGPVTALLTRITVFFLIVGLANRMSIGWTRRRFLVGLLLVVVGGVLGNGAPADNVWVWLAVGAGIGVLLLAAYILVLRDEASIIPLIVAVVVTAAILPDNVTRPYPAALEGAVVTVVVTWLVAFVWYRALARQ